MESEWIYWCHVLSHALHCTIMQLKLVEWKEKMISRFFGGKFFYIDKSRIVVKVRITRRPKKPSFWYSCLKLSQYMAVYSRFDSIIAGMFLTSLLGNIAQMVTCIQKLPSRNIWVPFPVSFWRKLSAGFSECINSELHNSVYLENIPKYRCFHGFPRLHHWPEKWTLWQNDFLFYFFSRTCNGEDMLRSTPNQTSSLPSEIHEKQQTKKTISR